MKKKIIALVSAVVLTLGVGVTAFAQTQKGELIYKDLTSNYKLDVDFKWLNGDDAAVAETKFVNPNNSNKVAARVEMWYNSDKMTDYKYDNSLTWAQVNYTWQHVSLYKSRHSIDNSTSTKELTVKSLTDN